MSHPDPAFVICVAALMIIAAIGLWLRMQRPGQPYARTPAYEPRHAPLRVRPVGAHAKRDGGFPDSRDVDDPDGSVWLRSLAAPDGIPPLDRRPHFHHDQPARTDVAIATLARVRDGLLALPVAGELDMLPDEPAPVAADLEGPFTTEPEPQPEPQPEPEWTVSGWTKANGIKLEKWLDENVRSVPIPGDDEEEWAA